MLKLAQNKRVKISGDIELKDRLVGVQRVVKVTKGGRTFGFSAGRFRIEEHATCRNGNLYGSWPILVIWCFKS